MDAGILGSRRCEETALTGLSLEDGLGHRVDRSVTSKGRMIGEGQRQ